MAKTAEAMRLDNEARAKKAQDKARRKQAIANTPIETRTAFELANGVYGLCDGQDNAGLKKQLELIEVIRQRLPDGATMLDLSIAYLEGQLAMLKARKED